MTRTNSAAVVPIAAGAKAQRQIKPETACHRKTTFLRPLLYINAFFAGAVVMGFEMLVSRHLNPWFGSGIFTWAALIATALTALCAGYFIGGWAADKWPGPRMLSALLALAGGGIVLMPSFAGPVCELVAMRVEDVRFGALLAAVILTFSPFALLGTYTPFAIRLVLECRERAGRVSGLLYGINTAGCIAGTLGVTFFLVPWAGTIAITRWLGFIALLSAASLALATPSQIAPENIGKGRGGPKNSRSLYIFFVGAFLFSMPAPAFAGPDLSTGPFSAGLLLSLPDGSVHTVESPYNNIYIKKKQRKILSMGFTLHGKDYGQCDKNLANEFSLVTPYTRLMTLGVAHTKQHDTLLMLGLGCGVTSRYMANHMATLTVDAVEIDPAVVRVAKRYFGVKTSARYAVHVKDARVFVNRNKGPWDIIMVDAYRGHHVPFHLMTREFYKTIAARLTRGGAAVFNLVGFDNTRLFQSAVATISDVFGNMAIYDSSDVFEEHPKVVIASLLPIDDAAVAKRAGRLQRAYQFEHPLPELLKMRTEIDPGAEKALVLTDDFAPVNILRFQKAATLK